MVPLVFFIALASVMFIFGVLGVLLRRNVLVVFMSLELMFNAANLAFIAFSRYHQVINGQLFVFFIMTVAAAEVAVGLALIVAIFRSRGSIDVDNMSYLKG